MDNNNIYFPECFSKAKNKVQSKFKYLDNATIDDSIQHAKIEYWVQQINEIIPDENKAMGWFLSVAYRYLYKEIGRLNRYAKISCVQDISDETDIEFQYINREILTLLSRPILGKINPSLINHALGYSLKELADEQNISLSAMKQRHIRERALARKKHFNF